MGLHLSPFSTHTVTTTLLTPTREKHIMPPRAVGLSHEYLVCKTSGSFHCDPKAHLWLSLVLKTETLGFLWTCASFVLCWPGCVAWRCLGYFYFFYFLFSIAGLYPSQHRILPQTMSQFIYSVWKNLQNKTNNNKKPSGFYLFIYLLKTVLKNYYFFLLR